MSSGKFSERCLSAVERALGDPPGAQAIKVWNRMVQGAPLDDQFSLITVRHALRELCQTGRAAYTENAIGIRLYHRTTGCQTDKAASDAGSECEVVDLTAPRPPSVFSPG